MRYDATSVVGDGRAEGGGASAERDTCVVLRVRGQFFKKARDAGESQPELQGWSMTRGYDR